MSEKEGNEKKVVEENGPKKVDDVSITIVLKLDLHCDGCAKKIKKSIRHLEGVETVKADYVNNKLTINGKVDVMYIKERVEYKTKKKVEIISPKPKKDEGGEKKVDDKQASNDQKPKEAQSTTMVLKIPLHCDGCIHKIKRIISKIDGVESVKPDNDKNLVTVKGTMNMKELIPYLKQKLKRNVDLLIPPKKEENKGSHDHEKKDDKKIEEGDNNKKEKEGGNNVDDDKKKNDVEKPIDNTIDQSGEKKKNDESNTTSGGDEKKMSADADVAPTIVGGGGGGEGSKNVEVVNKFEYYRHNPYTYMMPMYNQSYHNQDYGVSSSHGYVNEGYVMEYPRGPPLPPSPMSLHNPRASESDMFSVDNPNACSIM